MLGFSPLASAPLSDDGFVSISLSELLGSVTSTGAVGTVAANIVEKLDSLEAITFVSAVTVALSSKVVTGVQGVSAEGFTNSVIVQVTQPISTPVITGSVESVSIGGFEVDVSETLDSVPATVLLNQVIPRVSSTASIVGVEATGSVREVDVINTLKPLGFVALGLVNTVVTQLTEPLSDVSGQVFVGRVKVNLDAKVSTTGLTGFVTNTTQTAEVFDFEAVKETYSRKRTVYLSRVA